MDQYFLPFWADTLSGLFDGSHSGSFINSMMPDSPIEILLPVVIDDFSSNSDNLFRQTLEENTLLDWTPVTPTYLIHAIADDIVPIANAQVAYNTFIDNGAESVHLIEMPVSSGGHEDSAPLCLFTALDTIVSYQIVNVKGDVNLDGYLNINDQDLLIDNLLEYSVFNIPEHWAGDIDFDYSLSIFDLLSFSYLIENGPN